ncbi:hypothetical protein PV413_23790 [Streptomyces scabiei]|uniref:hypothetical protein n=1 Tax=Streptomyces scabiei TaxID=1930 RepID=UPI0029A7C069|nr:hypothetical protein [Streptomyces scabiei]MDX2566065.1 hypothetical protein [Streptomyces scabiei]MDX3150451.1 hypothetical protein [Streptomyces scabiei]MDX3161753.1 hypothetical protein [Streptomyces scabiei]MDX3288105.1 hypothetical protein [Streptomyces scabiei]
MSTDITSTHPYTDNHTDQLTAWLADTPHHFDGDGDLVIDTPDGEIHPRPGSWLIRWTDGEVTVASPRTAHRTYGPEGIAGRLRATQFTAAHWHQAAIDRDDIPGAHAIACIRAALAGTTDPNQLGIDDQAHDAFRTALNHHQEH